MEFISEIYFHIKTVFNHGVFISNLLFQRMMHFVQISAILNISNSYGKSENSTRKSVDSSNTQVLQFEVKQVTKDPVGSE